MMPVYTTNFQLPVPGPSDRPCDFPEQWCDFTTAVTAVLDQFEAVADRTNPVVPIAKMTLTAPVTVDNDSAIPFTDLILNNAGMVDFDNNNTTIVIKRPGRYRAILNTTLNSPLVANNIFFTQILPTGGGSINTTPAIAATLDLGSLTTRLIGVNTVATFHVATPPVYVRTNIDILIGTTITISDTALSLFWFADRATP